MAKLNRYVTQAASAQSRLKVSMTRFSHISECFNEVCRRHQADSSIHYHLYEASASAALGSQPGDGSSGTTIPITPGSTYQPSQRLTDTKNAPAQPLTPRDVSSTSRSKAIRTPGAVIAILNATDKLRTSCGVDSGDNDQTCRSTYRIFGIVGGQK